MMPDKILTTEEICQTILPLLKKYRAEKAAHGQELAGRICRAAGGEKSGLYRLPQGAGRYEGAADRPGQRAEAHGL